MSKTMADVGCEGLNRSSLNHSKSAILFGDSMIKPHSLETKIWREKLFKEKPWMRYFIKARSRCVPSGKYYKKGIQFNMTPEDFKFLWFRDKAYLLKRPSIDRENPDGHYSLNNSRFIEYYENVVTRRPKKGIGMWTKKYNECIKCGTKNRPYFSNGMCRICYDRKYNIDHKETIKIRKAIAYRKRTNGIVKKRRNKDLAQVITQHLKGVK